MDKTKVIGTSFDIGAKIIAAKLKNLPSTSGVYRMTDERGKVLYVGKAKNLKARVANYTSFTGLSDRIRLMVSLTRDLTIVTTKSEAEAFLLENQLIKTLHPYFNILLKDDKTYPHIVITDEEYPRLSKHRGAKRIKGDYFGPFASVSSVNNTLKTLSKAFGLRSCSDNEFKNRVRPCMLYQIKQCSAPCMQLISKADYKERVKEALAFLKGKSAEVQKELSREMYVLSEKQEYEKAALIRDRLRALNTIQSQNFADIPANVKVDVMAVYKQDAAAAVEVFFIRSGFSFGSYTGFYFSLSDNITEAELLENFIGQFYDKFNLPDEIVVNYSLPNAKSIAAALDIKINSSPIKARRKLLSDAAANAKGALMRKQVENTQSAKIYAELANLVGLDADNLKRIEVYDNSHIQGTNAIGVMIVADKEGFKRNAYRRFSIRANDYIKGDDLGMMREVLSRRLKHNDDEGFTLPSLIIMDGGRGQIKSALWAMYKEGLSLSDIKVIGIAKGEKHDGGDETLLITQDIDGKELTRIKLGKDSPLLFYIERLRDEAHRFAIGSHRNKRAKEALKSPLDEIEGIGVKRKKALLEHFGGLSAIKGASLAELEKVKGISGDLAQNIYDFFHS